MGYIPPPRPGEPDFPWIDRYHRIMIGIWLFALFVLPPAVVIILWAIVY